MGIKLRQRRTRTGPGIVVVVVVVRLVSVLSSQRVSGLLLELVLSIMVGRVMGVVGGLSGNTSRSDSGIGVRGVSRSVVQCRRVVGSVGRVGRSIVEGGRGVRGNAVVSELRSVGS